MQISIILVAVGVFLLFRALVFLNKTLPLSKGFKVYTGYMLPAAELIAWLVFIFWAIRHLYEAFNTTALIGIGILTLLLIVPLWFLIRDFIYGLILKLQRKIDLECMIEVEDIKGIVIKAGHFSFDIRTKDGNINTIPYSKIMSKIITTYGTNINLTPQLISFRVHESHDINSIIPALKSTLINAPWVAASKNPVVKELRQVNEHFIADVFVYLIKNEHADEVKSYVIRNMNNTVS